MPQATTLARPDRGVASREHGEDLLDGEREHGLASLDAREPWLDASHDTESD